MTDATILPRRLNKVPEPTASFWTIKVLATLLKPTMGTVHVLGTNVLLSPQTVRRNIGYVPFGTVAA